MCQRPSIARRSPSTATGSHRSVREEPRPPVGAAPPEQPLVAAAPATYTLPVEDPRRDHDNRLQQLIRDVGIAVQESSGLLANLYVERTEYRHFELPYEESTAKRYFLSRSLMDVQTSVGAQIRLIDHLRRECAQVQEDSEGVHAITLASIVAEQSLWRRRLAEVLARLVLFSTTNTNAHYFHYLLLVDADDNEREVENLHKDFGAKSATLARRAENMRATLAALPVSLPVWYAQERRKGLIKPAPATEIIRAAITAAVPLERTALGYSYFHSFSAPSHILHFSTTARRDACDQHLIDFGTVALMLLSSAITARVSDLAGLPTTMKLGQGGSPGRADLPDVGDYVVVTLDREAVFVAEVLSTGAGSGCIGRIRVRFVGEAPYKDIVEDDFPSDLVHGLVRRTELTRQVRASLPPNFLPTEDELHESCRRAIEQAWTLGVREVYRKWLRASRK